MNKSPKSMGKKKSPIAPSIDLHSQLYRSDLLRMVVATVCATLSYAALAYVFSLSLSFSNPLDLLPEGEIFEARPEPLEGFLYRFAVLSIPLFLLGYSLLLFKVERIRRWFDAKYYTVVSILALCLAFALLYIGLHQANPNYVAGAESFNNSRDRSCASNWMFYFLESFIYTNSALYLIFVAPLVTFCLALPSLYPQTFSKPIFRWTGLLVVLIYALVYAVETYQVFQFVFPYTWESKIDFGVVYYPSVQVFRGAALLVNEFTTNYGVYAHFLNPIFQITGLSVSTFSGVMALLMILIWVLWLTALLRVLNHRLLVILCFSSMMFISLMIGKIATSFDPYFALFPIRLLVPSILIGLGTLYLYRPRTWLYYTLFVVLGFGILWNPEFGIVTFLAWILTLIFRELSLHHWKNFVRPIVKHSIIGMGIAVVCFIVYGWSIRLQCGQFPDFSLLFTSITVFGKYGLLALEMPLLHPWIFVALVYIWGLCISIVSLVRNQVKASDAFIFMVSVLGIGLFAYYQGRSHNWNLLSICWPAILLIGIYVQMILNHLKTHKRDYAAWLGLFLCTAVLGFSAIDLVRHQTTLSLLHEQRSDKIKQADEQATIESNMSWFRDSLNDLTPKVYMFCSNKHQALYLNSLASPSAFNPASVDLFMRSDIKRLVSDLEHSPYDVFLEPTGFYYAQFTSVQAVIAARYEVIGHHNAFLRLRRRPLDTLWPGPRLISKDTSGLIFHRYYDQDSSSTQQRIRDVGTPSEALKGLQLPLTFDAVFKPSSIPTGASVLFSSIGDSNSSFVFFSPDAFVFQTAEGFGYRIPVDSQQWSHLTFVFTSAYTDIFLNGHLLYRYPAIELDSSAQIILGRNQAQSYFIGSISEWRLRHGIILPTK